MSSLMRSDRNIEVSYDSNEED